MGACPVKGGSVTPLPRKNIMSKIHVGACPAIDSGSPEASVQSTTPVSHSLPPREGSLDSQVSRRVDVTTETRPTDPVPFREGPVPFREYREEDADPACAKKRPYRTMPRLPAPLGAPPPEVTAVPALDFITAPTNPAGPRRFTVLSLFAGCGGSSLGYKWAGGKVVAAVEWDKDSAETYRRNHQGTPVLERDVADVTGKELLDLTGLSEGELDVLDGSPPCQGFSLAGKRRLDDPRNQLFREYVRLLNELRPRTFVMENVAGMVKGDHREIFAEALRALKGAGYTVRVWLLDAMYFGVPQSRQRLIFQGVRNDLAGALDLSPSCPEAFTGPIPFAEACPDLRGNVEGDRMLGEFLRRFRHVQPRNKWSTQDGPYTAMKGSSGGAMSLQWAAWDRVCGTIVKSETAIAGIVHPDRERYLSLAEARRCASFPDAFEFTDRRRGIERIGNSVPPRFMQAIAEHVYRTLLAPIHTLLAPIHAGPTRGGRNALTAGAGCAE